MEEELFIEKEKIHSSSIEKDYLYCEEIIKKHSKSFYFAFSKLPRQKAQAVYAIYAFCRLADDSIDEAETKAEQKEALTFLTNELNRFEQHTEADHPIWRALRDVFDRFDMDIQPFYDQLNGQAMDYDFKQPKTLKEVENYSYYVAGSVGLMLLPIIATENQQQLQDQAVSLGIAMQLTNILRDVGEDFKSIDRIYLPSTLMEKEHYSIEDLKQEKVNEAFIKIWETIAKRAEHLFLDFTDSLYMFDRDSQYPVALSARVYAGILDAVRENGYDCLTKRNKTSFMKKMAYMCEVKKSMS
ncbi:Phytoene synthase [Alkalibacterium sp. AK22]|uniref:phytoene/squalene synthase family protein n=1 Tax=Alkalibacterium sp. AK22 TaxID=1229520 RepID=UPI00044E59E9|nr:phytoene/squalene synthase family protein [Alkalibacterium sp. AK22]EXJ23198.1 Phytoene synthase [Alkalibacterium sp. AK22]